MATAARPEPGAAESGTSGPDPSADIAIRVLGGVVAVWLAALAAVCEVFWTPLRIGEVRAPVSLVAAVVMNIALPIFARWATRSRHVAPLPSLVWFVVILTFAGGTAEGDIALAGNDWVALLLLLAGSVSAAIGAYLALLPTPPRWLGGLGGSRP
ncbi:MAG: hypothetical protein GEU94_05050 [Micromonosporaceae bacterium]|nr:hypothetical protein [Micromonosporaceae bacterium]